MADFSRFSKEYGTAMYPVHAKETSGLFRRCEPVMSPAKLKSRYLKGIPLTFPNGDTITDEDLKDYINIAMNEVELLIGATLDRVQFKEKHAFDRSLYLSWVHIMAEHGPIISLEKLAIVPASGEDIYDLPAEWIETANFAKRQINVVPLLSAYGIHSQTGAVGNAGIAFLAMMDRFGLVPAYWEITYTTGVSKKEGQLPIPINDLVGTLAAINILSFIAATNLFTSQSLSQDGISQSSSGPGPNIYLLRIQDLEKKKDELVRKLKALFGNKFFTSNI